MWFGEYMRQPKLTQDDSDYTVKDLLMLSVSSACRSRIKRALLAGKIKLSNAVVEQDVSGGHRRYEINGHLFLDEDR